MCANKIRFDSLLDRLTRPNNVESKRVLKRKILKMIWEHEIEPKYALLSITANMASNDPRVGILSIDILDSWVMICGRLIQDEIFKVSYMEVLTNILERTSNETIKSEILHLIYDWSQTLEDPIIRETVERLTVEGYEFPSESDMVSATGEVEEEDTNSCHRCHVEIVASEEKQNCEICGKTVCSTCLKRRNDDHGILNLICEPCEQVIIRNNNTRNNITELSRNEGESWVQTTEENDEGDLDLAMALSKSQETVHETRLQDRDFYSGRDVLPTFEELQLQEDGNSCHRCHLKISSGEGMQNCEVCGQTFCSECLISKNDNHGINNLVCEPCEGIIIGDNSSNGTNESTGNQGENWYHNIGVFDQNDEADLDLAVAISQSQVMDELDVTTHTSSDPNYNAPECTVCCERRVNAMLHPCSHLCMCYECACEQWQGSGNGFCPLCRIPIEDVINTKRMNTN